MIAVDENRAKKMEIHGTGSTAGLGGDREKAEEILETVKVIHKRINIRKRL